MYNRKISIYILLLLIVSICAISAVSAADNATDTIATIEADDSVAVDEANADDVAVDKESANDIETNVDENALEKTEEIKEAEKLSANDDDSKLNLDETQEKTSAIAPLPADLYSVSFDKEEFTIASNKAGKINIHINPCKLGTVGYQYYYWVCDEDLYVVWESPLMTGGTSSSGGFYYNIPANSILPGSYIIAAVNAYDEEVLDSAILYVSGTAVITANSNYNSVYKSGAKMTARITDKRTGEPLPDSSVMVVFTKGKTSVTKYYKPNANGYISFVPPVGVGTWTVKFSSGLSHISASAVTKTATLTKATAKIVAYKVTEYKGHKTTLKAKVTTNGKNVNEGKVTFKINGKYYNAAVKNGIATVKVNLKKVGVYKFTAKFTGSNFKDVKKVKAKAKLKPSFKTKVYTKNYALFTFDSKVAKIIVLTKYGQKVKNGKLKVVANGQVQYVKVKNGVAKVKISGLHAMKHFKGFTSSGETYQKYITQKFKVKYIATSHKYKSSGNKKFKVVSVFKCPGCGKSSSHYHIGYDSYGRYYKHFISIQ